MARRRRRGHFGLPGGTHLVYARGSAKAARWWLKELRTNLKNGNCVGALDALTTANRMSASATTDRRSIGKKVKRGPQFQASTLRKAQQRFARACVKR